MKVAFEPDTEIQMFRKELTKTRLLSSKKTRVSLSGYMIETRKAPNKFK